MSKPLTPKPSRAPRTCHGAGTQKEAEGTGGLIPIADRMKMPVKVPCAECPLRRSATPGHLGGYSAKMYLDMMSGPASVSCHMAPGFKSGEISRMQHCTGVAAFRANVGYHERPEAQEYAPAAVEAAIHQGEDRSEFFASPLEFYEHHAPAQQAQKHAQKEDQ